MLKNIIKRLENNKIDVTNEMIEVTKVLLDECCYDEDQIMEIVSNEYYILWYDCKDMSDVAYYFVHEFYILDNSCQSEFLLKYFDYEMLGRDLSIEGQFYELPYINGYVEVQY